jgi:uncharacterized protein
MTFLKPQAGDIPRPFPSALSQRFWEGCREHRLLFQRCEDCRSITHTPAVVCAACNRDRLVWEQSSGIGTVYSWTTVWRPQTPAFEVPYNAVIVELDEGWHFLSNLVGCEHDECHIGMHVQVQFHDLDSDVTLPYFRPV